MSNIAKHQPIHARVLVIEDNLISQKMAQRLLEHLGCHVDLAANGRQGLDLLNLRSYDLVFMDCEMPEMDGFEATREIRRRHAEHHIPVIAMTAGTQQDDQIRCLAAGMDDYLSKPVRVEVLAGALARWIFPTISPEPLKQMNEVPPQAEPGDETEDGRVPAALDLATIQRLKNLAQATEASWFTRLLEKFQSDAVADITTLRRAVVEDDGVSLSLVAHRLKGASLNIGARHMGDICRRLETLDRNQTMDAALVAQLELEFSRVQAGMEQEISKG
jgi:CheY-like chemotaxis protein